MEAQAEDPLLRVSVLLMYVFEYFSWLPDREAVTPYAPAQRNESFREEPPPRTPRLQNVEFFFSLQKNPTEQPVGA